MSQIKMPSMGDSYRGPEIGAAEVRKAADSIKKPEDQPAIPASQQLGADKSEAQAQPPPTPVETPTATPQPAPEPQHKSKLSQIGQAANKTLGGQENTQRESQAKVINLADERAARANRTIGGEHTQQQTRSSNIVSIEDAAKPRQQWKSEAKQNSSFKNHFESKAQGNVIKMPSQDRYVPAPMKAIGMVMGQDMQMAA